jgi:Zn-dependent protease
VLFHLAEPSALLGIALALILGLFAHDAAQIGAARLAHDVSAAKSGRLTTRAVPERASPFSIVAMVIVGVGWAEPVPMNEVWRKRRFHVAAAVLAGPLAYLVLATASLALLRLTNRFVLVYLGSRVPEIAGGEVFVPKMLAWMAVTFGSMFIVSLIPVPPMDGGRVLFLFTPRDPGWEKARYQLTQTHLGVAIVLAILLLPILLPGFPSVVGQLIGPLLHGLSHIVGLTLG